MDKNKVRQIQRYFQSPLHNIELTWQQAVWVLKEMEAERDIRLVADSAGRQTILGLPDPDP